MSLNNTLKKKLYLSELMLNINNIHSYWKHAQCQNKLWLPFNSSNAELNPICYLLPLLGAHHILHISRIRVKPLLFFEFLFS